MRIRVHTVSLLLCSIVAVAGSSESNAGEFKVSEDEALKKIASDTRKGLAKLERMRQNNVRRMQLVQTDRIRSTVKSTRRRKVKS